MIRFFIYRPVSQDELPPMPVSLKALGFHMARGGWQEKNPGKHRLHCGCFWVSEGEAEIVVAGKEHRIQSGQFIHYYPLEAHFIRVLSEQFGYFWFTFDGLLAVELLSSFRFPRGPVDAGPPPESLFKAARDSMTEYSAASRYLGSSCVYQLLARAKAPESTVANTPADPVHKVIEEFKHLVDTGYMDRRMNLNSLAVRLQCHRTTITRLLKSCMDTTPVQYLNNIRMQKALQMLHETTLTAAEISDRCGFATPEYFSRKVKQLTGVPPHRFRNRK